MPSAPNTVTQWSSISPLNDNFHSWSLWLPGDLSQPSFCWRSAADASRSGAQPLNTSLMPCSVLRSLMHPS